MTEESPFWTVFGKASAVITTIAAIVGVWVIINQADEDLELRAVFRPYAISPDVRDAVNGNIKAFSYSNLSVLFKEELPKELYYQNLDLINLIQDAHKKSWGGIKSNEVDKYRGYSSLVLSNNGEKTANDIEIDFPEKGLALIINPDESIKITKFNRVIKVNDLRANNEIVLTIWSESRLSKYDYDDLNVTHKNGVGEVTWPIEATGISWYFATYPYFIPLFFFVIFMIGTAVGSSSKKKTGEEVSSNEDSDGENA